MVPPWRWWRFRTQAFLYWGIRKDFPEEKLPTKSWWVGWSPKAIQRDCFLFNSGEPTKAVHPLLTLTSSLCSTWFSAFPVLPYWDSVGTWAALSTTHNPLWICQRLLPYNLLFHLGRAWEEAILLEPHRLTLYSTNLSVALISLRTYQPNVIFLSKPSLSDVVKFCWTYLCSHRSQRMMTPCSGSLSLPQWLEDEAHPLPTCKSFRSNATLQPRWAQRGTKV